MERLTRVVSAAFVGVAGLVLAAPAGAQGAAAPAASSMQARITSGSITGTVLDDSGEALTGAMVSALGATLASTVTDDGGRFTFNGLPPGEYLLRAHKLGFAASVATLVNVGDSPSTQRFELRRLAGSTAAVGTAGVAEPPVAARPIMAAGFDLPAGAAAGETTADADGADHPHTESAWRLRHIKRSILKDTTPLAVVTDSEGITPNGNLVGRAMVSAASLASSLFTGFPLSGEVNFLTTGAVAPGALLSSTAFPRGVAYLALAAPGAGGDWLIRAAMSQGDLSSWIVAGAFSSRPGRDHDYQFGLTYSTQEYIGGNPAALAAVTDGNRNVGELYAFDRWAIAPALTLEYGARFAHYDYLESRGLLSPRLGFTVEAGDGVRFRAAVAQRMVAPGAEEFLSSSTPGPWLPPERTFAPLRATDALRVERSQSYDVGFEKDLGGAAVLGVSRFHQSVDDQLVTLFGLRMPNGPRSVGHYYVGTAGSVEASGWAVRAFACRRAHPRLDRLQPHPRAMDGTRRDLRARSLRAGRRPAGQEGSARPHELAVRGHQRNSHARLRALQVEQRLRPVEHDARRAGPRRPLRRAGEPGAPRHLRRHPLGSAGRAAQPVPGPTDPASVYDELLVVRPPKRLVGGFLVRF